MSEAKSEEGKAKHDWTEILDLSHCLFDHCQDHTDHLGVAYLAARNLLFNLERAVVRHWSEEELARLRKLAEGIDKRTAMAEGATQHGPRAAQ